MNKMHGFALIGAFVLIAIGFIYVSSSRDLTSLESVLFQVFGIASGLAGSYVVGRETTKKAALELVKPHARSAYRRLLSLYSGLSRLVQEIQSSNSRFSENQTALDVLDKIRAIAVELIYTSNDALEDWRDILPEELEKLKEIAMRQQKSGEIYGGQ